MLKKLYGVTIMCYLYKMRFQENFMRSVFLGQNKVLNSNIKELRYKNTHVLSSKERPKLEEKSYLLLKWVTLIVKLDGLTKLGDM